MGQRVLRVGRLDDGVAAADLRQGIEALQAELEVDPDFPADVLAAAEHAAQHPRLPDRDRTDLPFVTLDPAGSMDLDQAMHLARDGDGYVVHYAIADVAAFVTQATRWTWRRTAAASRCTAPTAWSRCHPPCSVPGLPRCCPTSCGPAFVWTITLDAAGATTSARVERARVRSTARLDYATVDVEHAPADSTLALLREVGELRIAQEAARGGGVAAHAGPGGRRRGRAGPAGVPRDAARRELERTDLPADRASRAAAMMVEHRVGILRTLPPAPPEA